MLAGLATIAAGCGEPERTVQLTVHAPLPSEALEHAERIFEEDFPTVDLRAVEATPEETLAALRGGQPVDLWWGAPVTALETAADEGLLAPYDPPWLRQPGVGRPDADGRWQVSLVSPFVIAFNRERVPLAEAPTDWIDLFHHGWTDEVVLLDPQTDPELAYFHGAMLVDALRAGGDEQVGFDWLGRLDGAVGAYTADVDDVLGRLERGEASLTILPRHVVEAARHDGRPWLHYRLPESGSPILARGVAVSASAVEAELARVFVDLVGTMEVATVTRLHTRWMPGHGDVDMSLLPADFEIDMPWRPLPLAADTLERELDGWLERWELEVRGRGPIN